jgi:chaperonin GroEL
LRTGSKKVTDDGEVYNLAL